MRLYGAEVYHGGVFRPLDIEIENGVITALTEWQDRGDVDCRGMDITPLLTDIHSHGCMGHDFSELEAGDLEIMDNFYLKHGVGEIVPTIISSPRGEYKKIAGSLKGRKIRLEGPFFGEVKKGAHKRENLTLPDYGLIQEIGYENIAMVDIDPTLDDALEMIAHLTKMGVKTSIAHTVATYDIAMKAFDAGARHVTHMFNAMSPLHHRESGVIGAAYDRKDVFVELVCDGFHVSPNIVRMVFDLFPGRVCVISDSHKTMGLTEGGVALLPDGTIAGAVQGICQGAFNLRKWGIPLNKAIEATCDIPRRAMGLEPRDIAVGQRGNLIAVKHGSIDPSIIIKDGIELFQ